METHCNTSCPLTDCPLWLPLPYGLNEKWPLCPGSVLEAGRVLDMGPSWETQGWRVIAGLLLPSALCFPIGWEVRSHITSSHYHRLCPSCHDWLNTLNWSQNPFPLKRVVRLSCHRSRKSNEHTLPPPRILNSKEKPQLKHVSTNVSFSFGLGFGQRGWGWRQVHSVAKLEAVVVYTASSRSFKAT